ncbi:hypothetical protein LARI1_G000095 [Lachnellula arida]|uniref:Uncharacterized protein n=1 Tax=Lachnellula arida TaxID=1316785 RepID=A0A8T9BQG6_9HELO|nr:hypothetical protein LARI1_G000095 [Lachnellula arida]
MAVMLFTPLRCFEAVCALLIIYSLYSMDILAVASVAKKTLYEDLAKTQSHGAGTDSGIAVEHPSSPETVSISTAPQAVSSPAVEVPDTLPAGNSQLDSKPPLILYAYSESDTARVNIEFFIRHGLHAAADFVFIINGNTDIAAIIPEGPNIRVVQRENVCYDIGAHAEVLTKDDLYKGYKRFIMLNASIRGPFLPSWSQGCWSDMYLGKVTDEVKLVGMTANCVPTFHVQSMIWATDTTGLETLLFPSEAVLKAYALNPPKPFNSAKEQLEKLHPQKPGMNTCFHDMNSAVTAEIGASSLVKAAGYKVDAFMSAYHNMERYEEVCNSSRKGDVLWDKKYFGTNVHPFETLFMKSNREIDEVGLARHSEWVAERGYSSYDFCKVMEMPALSGGNV